MLSGIYDRVPDATFEAPVSTSFSVADQSHTVDCDVEPGGCIVGVKVLLSGGGTVEAWAPLTFAGAIDVEPNRNLGDGDSLTASGDGVEPGAWTLAQCTTGFVDAPDPALVAASCSPPTAVTVSGGAFSTAVAVHDPLVTVDGSSHDCGYTGCAVVLARAGDPAARSAAISFGPPTVSADPATDIGRNAPVAVSVAGIPGESARLAVCASSVDFASCTPFERVELDSVGAALAPNVSVPPESAGGVTPAYDCNEEPCSIAVFVDDEDLVASTPVTFAPSPVISITPRAGLLEGQSVTVSVNNLTPGASYAIFGCGAGCEPPIDVTASAGGVATTTATVSQVAGVDYCRSNCQFALWADGLFVAKAYSMAEGAVAASPADGLADGDTVQVSGTDLMPTLRRAEPGPVPHRRLGAGAVRRRPGRRALALRRLRPLRAAAQRGGRHRHRVDLRRRPAGGVVVHVVPGPRGRLHHRARGLRGRALPVRHGCAVVGLAHADHLRAGVTRRRRPGGVSRPCPRPRGGRG